MANTLKIKVTANGQPVVTATVAIQPAVDEAGAVVAPKKTDVKGECVFDNLTTDGIFDVSVQACDQPLQTKRGIVQISGVTEVPTFNFSAGSLEIFDGGFAHPIVLAFVNDKLGLRADTVALKHAWSVPPSSKFVNFDAADPTEREVCWDTTGLQGKQKLTVRAWYKDGSIPLYPMEISISPQAVNHIQVDSLPTQSLLLQFNSPARPQATPTTRPCGWRFATAPKPSLSRAAATRTLLTRCSM